MPILGSPQELDLSSFVTVVSGHIGIGQLRSVSLPTTGTSSALISHRSTAGFIRRQFSASTKLCGAHTFPECGSMFSGYKSTPANHEIIDILLCSLHPTDPSDLMSIRCDIRSRQLQDTDADLGLLKDLRRCATINTRYRNDNKLLPHERIGILPHVDYRLPPGVRIIHSVCFHPL